MSTDSSGNSPVKRPWLISFLAGWFLLGSVVSLLLAGAAVYGEIMSRLRVWNPQSLPWLLEVLFTGGLPFAGYSLFMGMLWAVMGFGLWKLRNWARILTVIVKVADLLISAFLAYYLLPPEGHTVVVVVAYALNVLVVVYLLLPRTKRAFIPAAVGAAN